MTVTENIELAAIDLAVTAHRDQVDKLGDPYIGHLARVACRVPPLLRPVAWLHDILEDTDTEPDALLSIGVRGWLFDVVLALTHEPNTSNEDYWAVIRRNAYARLVKFADIADNQSRLGRLAETDPETAARLTIKYDRAIAALS